MTSSAASPREQRLIFGEVAEAYDARRPSYPKGLIDDVLAYTGLDEPSMRPAASPLHKGTRSSIEVGAGTGKASVLFAERGIELVCIEPSAEMAAIARRHLRPYPAVSLVETSWEEFQEPPDPVDLLFSAQAWHWTSKASRYAKAARVLGGARARPPSRPRSELPQLGPPGTLALLWNVEAGRGGGPLSEALDLAYAVLGSAPRSMDRATRLNGNDWVMAEINESGLFEAVTVVRHLWHKTYDLAEWIDLLGTQSDHLMLDPAVRDELFTRIADAVAAHGGSVEVEYVSSGYLTRPLV